MAIDCYGLPANPRSLLQTVFRWSATDVTIAADVTLISLPFTSKVVSSYVRLSWFINLDSTGAAGTGSRTMLAQRVNPDGTATTLNDAVSITLTVSGASILSNQAWLFMERAPTVGPVTYRIRCTSSDAAGTFIAIAQSLLAEEVDGAIDIQNALS